MGLFPLGHGAGQRLSGIGCEAGAHFVFCLCCLVREMSRGAAGLECGAQLERRLFMQLRRVTGAWTHGGTGGDASGGGLCLWEHGPSAAMRRLKMMMGFFAFKF